MVLLPPVGCSPGEGHPTRRTSQTGRFVLCFDYGASLSNKRTGLNGLRVLLVASLLVSSTSTVAENVLRLVGNVWPPYTDRHLPEGGLSTDLIGTALGRAGYQVDYVEVPWERALQGLRSGTYDMTNGWPAAKRVSYVRSSRPFLTNRMRWIQRSDGDFHFDGLDSLVGYAIALSRGYSYDDKLEDDARLDKGYVADFIQAARMVLAGRVDLTLEDERTALFHFDRELKDVSASLDFVPGEFAVLNLSLVVRNSHPQQEEIIAAFDREIALMVDDGTYADIFARHGLPVPESLAQP